MQRISVKAEPKIDLFGIPFGDSPIVVVIVSVIVLLAIIAITLNPILEFFERIKGLWKRPNGENDNKIHGDYRADLVASVSAGKITTKEAIELAYALAGERYENPPPVAEVLPIGHDSAEEFVREFVSLATSKNERERKAAALEAQGKTEDALELLAELAEEDTTQAAERWKARGAIAFNAFTVKAIDSYEQAIGCSPNDADAHNQLGHLYMRIGDVDRAKNAYERVLALGNQSADKTLLAMAYGNLGVVEKNRGDLDAAEAYHKKSLALNEALGRKEGMASTYGNLGLIEKNRGDLDAAEAYLKKSLALDEVLGRKEGMANQYGNLGLIEQTRGNLDAAEAYLKKSLALDEALGRKEGMASDYANLGGVEKTRGNLDAACRYWRKAHDLFAQIGMPHMVEKVAEWLRDAGCDDPSGEAGAP